MSDISDDDDDLLEYSEHIPTPVEMGMPPLYEGEQ